MKRNEIAIKFLEGKKVLLNNDVYHIENGKLFKNGCEELNVYYNGLGIVHRILKEPKGIWELHKEETRWKDSKGRVCKEGDEGIFYDNEIGVNARFYTLKDIKNNLYIDNENLGWDSFIKLPPEYLPEEKE